MTHYGTSRQRRIELDRLADVLDVERCGLTFVGVDEHDSTHLYQRHDRVVYVLEQDDEVEHEQTLDNRPLQDWVDFVDDDRGWTECYYDDRVTLGELVADVVDAEAA